MNTFIFGHKNPDTDSVCSSIAYSYYKEKNGEIAEPRVLGPIRKEALFVLDYFDVKKPKLLSNVKIQANDLNYDKIRPLTPNSSVYEAYITMEREKIHTLPIINEEDGRLSGIVSIKDIASSLIHVHDMFVDTTLPSFINVFSDYTPRILSVDNFDIDIKGTLKVFNPNTPQDSIINPDDIIILKKYHKEEFFKKLNSNIKLLILTQYSDLEEKELDILRIHGITIVSLNISSPMIIKKIHQTDRISSIMRKEKIIHFTLTDYLHDIRDIMLKTNFRNYPLVDENGVYVGLLSRKHLLKPGKKKVILVDHNEFVQSASGIEEANILEIVDHHKIGGINTTEPIQFLNMPVGSTCTIVYEQLRNSNINIPKHIAGCLISGIISDTLYFKSPTCTRKDIDAVSSLNQILKLDLDEYAAKLFKAGSSIDGMSIKDILYNDFKEFKIKSRKIAISQLFTMDIEQIREKQDELLEYMKKLCADNSYNTLLLAVTDILKEGSYMYYISDDNSIIRQSFDIDDEQGTFAPMIVSRKKQIVPMITSTLEIS